MRVGAARLKSQQARDTAYYACYGRIQGHACRQSSVPERLLETQLTVFFDAFALPAAEQEHLVKLYLRDAKQSAAASGEHQPDPVARRAQLTARLERQQELYALGDWTRDRFLQARHEILAELEILEVETEPEQSGEVLTRLGAYAREVQAAWRDADCANRRLLVRTLFEQVWMVGDRIVAVSRWRGSRPFSDFCAAVKSAVGTRTTYTWRQARPGMRILRRWRHSPMR